MPILSLSIRIDGAAFEEAPYDELHRILNFAAFHLDCGEDEFQLFDINGNFDNYEQSFKGASMTQNI